MLNTFALVCGYISDKNIIYAEEAIYLLQLDFPNDVSDVDDYLWDESENIFSEIEAPMGGMKLFDLGAGETVECELFHREIRQISNTSIELAANSSKPIFISRCCLEFQSYTDFEDYMKANEPDNPDRVLDIKMSRFS